MMRFLVSITVVRSAVAVVSDFDTDDHAHPERCMKGARCRHSMDDVAHNGSSLHATSLKTSCKKNVPFDFCSGLTPEETHWQQHGPKSLFIEIDTSSCTAKFVSTPIYEASIYVHGAAQPTIPGNVARRLEGSMNKLKVYIEHWDESGTALDLTAAEAKRQKWQVAWKKRSGDFDCVGRSVDGWTAYDHGIKMDVDTSKCGFTDTPKYFTSLGGISDHARTVGAGQIYLATSHSFQVRIRGLELDAVIAALENTTSVDVETATRLQWHVNWVAHPRGIMATDPQTNEDYEAQVVSAEGVCVDTPCGCPANTPANCAEAVGAWAPGRSGDLNMYSSLGPRGEQMMCRSAYGLFGPTAVIPSYQSESDEELSPFTTVGPFNRLGWDMFVRPEIGRKVFPKDYRTSDGDLSKANAKDSAYFLSGDVGWPGSKRACSGRQPADMWTFTGAHMSTTVDTSRCGFRSTPVYLTNFVMKPRAMRCGWLRFVYGGMSVYDATESSFTVHAYKEKLYMGPDCSDVKQRVESILGGTWSGDENYFVYLFEALKDGFEESAEGTLEWMAFEEDTADWMPDKFA